MYENTSLYIPLVQPQRFSSSISVNLSSYWHISALYSLLYDSITLPSRTRAEHPFAMDMYDFSARVNIHGQRKLTNPEVTALLDKPGINDVMSLGWPEVPGDRSIMATVIRGFPEDVDTLTTTLGRGRVISERLSLCFSDR